jgi:hypothetical protein
MKVTLIDNGGFLKFQNRAEMENYIVEEEIIHSPWFTSKELIDAIETKSKVNLIQCYFYNFSKIIENLVFEHDNNFSNESMEELD